VSHQISFQAIQKLVDKWLEQERPVAAPVRLQDNRVMYQPLTASSQIVSDGFVHAENSIKEFFFPRTEKLYNYKFVGQDVELQDVTVEDAPRMVLFARPCDAASLPILDHVFNWDYKDEFYNRRRRATTVVTLACTTHDANCFCTSVGLGPDSEQGSDVLLLPLGDGNFEVRMLTDKGRDLLGDLVQTSDKTAQIPEGPAKKFDVDEVLQFLEENFDSPFWEEQTLRCLGCAACAYNCPTCHCFDIVDEGNACGGCRVKNWDACQFSMFSLHASGHNPRSVQAQRQRQRIQHKFRIYHEKFGTYLCTGCGNCGRNCPVSLGVLNVVEAIHRRTVKASEKD